MQAKNFTSKKFSEILHNIGSTEAKMSEADSNLVRSKTIHQVIALVLILRHKLYDTKKASSVQIFLISFYKQVRHFNANVSNVLNDSALNKY